MGSEYAHMLLNLFAIIVLMLGMFFLIRKFKLAKYAGNNKIRIINVIPIGTKEKVILLEVNNTHILLGSTPSHIQTLHVFNELIETEKNVDKKKNFSEIMRDRNTA